MAPKHGIITEMKGMSSRIRRARRAGRGFIVPPTSSRHALARREPGLFEPFC
jgi:hypothetical protein